MKLSHWSWTNFLNQDFFFNIALIYLGHCYDSFLSGDSTRSYSVLDTDTKKNRFLDSFLDNLKLCIRIDNRFVHAIKWEN